MSLSNILSNIFLYKEPTPQEEQLGVELLENEDKSKLNDNKNEDSPSGNSNNDNQNQQSDPASESEDIISTVLKDTLQYLRQKFSSPKNQDIVFREFTIGSQTSAALVFVDGMVDKQTLNLSILPRLMDRDINEAIDGIILNKQDIGDYLIRKVIAIQSVSKTNQCNTIMHQILNGVTALFVDGCAESILIETRGFEKRAVESPKTEAVVKGSQEGFTENLRTNISLLRKIIKNEHLITETIPAGKTNASNCALLYIDGIANSAVVEEIKKRMSVVKTDAILGQGMKEQFIEDNSFMILPQVLSTERPDRCASFLLNGQIVILTEGTPFAMGVPANFFQFFYTSEDANLRWPYATMLRFIRIFGFFCALLLPGLYCAVVLYHPEMIPTELLSSIAQAKESVPFPTVIEILILEMSFELIREGAIRVPGVIGQTLGIVGALILGQAAVSAGLVSPVLVIIVSITALGSFTVPNYQMGLAARVCRFLFLFTGAAFGFFGIAALLYALIILTCSMKSFGVPYLSPIAPKTKTKGSTLFKSPIWVYTDRPDEMNATDVKRQGNNKKTWI